MDSQIIGAIKIKDGLFIGDEYSAKVNNKITFKIILITY